MSHPPKPTLRKIGFARLSPERQRQLAQQGGRQVQKLGTAHRWTADEARAAGRKGGLKRAKGKR